MLLNRNLSIEHAVSDALAFVRKCDEDPGVIEAGDGNFYADLASLDDTDAIEGLFEGPAIAMRNQILVDTPDELMYAAEALSRQTRLEIPRPPMAKRIAHENEHAVCMLEVGVVAAKYGLAITDYAPGFFKRRVGWQPLLLGFGGTRQPITKIAHASIIAAPAVPSVGDNIRLQQMGYSNKDDVTTRAAQHNL